MAHGEIVKTGYNANTPPNQTPFSYLSLSIEKMFLTGEASCRPRDSGAQKLFLGPKKVKISIIGLL